MKRKFALFAVLVLMAITLPLPVFAQHSFWHQVKDQAFNRHGWQYGYGSYPAPTYYPGNQNGYGGYGHSNPWGTYGVQRGWGGAQYGQYGHGGYGGGHHGGHHN